VPFAATGSELQPPDEPATQELAAKPRLAQPLPLPLEDARTWMQEWLDLVGLPGRTAATGC